jgi:hypothetical protein
VRSPRFRRDPFIRDVASDPGGATVPRVTAPHMLPSAVATASAPATSRISWLNPTPQMITVYASPWSSPSPTQHSLPGGRYPLPGPDFHRLDRASFAWRTTRPSNKASQLALDRAVDQVANTAARLSRDSCPSPLSRFGCCRTLNGHSTFVLGMALVAPQPTFEAAQTSDRLGGGLPTFANPVANG